LKFINGNIITMQGPTERATSMEITDDLITAIDVQGRGKDPVIDLGGRTVVPGFVDAHTHFHYWASTLHHLDMEPAGSLEAALRQVAERVAKTPKGNWIEGRGLNKNRWAAPDFPSRHDLDRVAPDHPVAIFSKDEHSLWVNSAALARAGITRDTADPPGGKIGHDGDGDPNGMLFETAYELVMSRIPEPTPGDTVQSLGRGAAMAHRRGVTGVHDVGSWEAWEAYRLWPEPTLDVVKYFPADMADEVVQLGFKSGEGSPQLRIGGLKLFTDGALGSQTAFMWEAYEGDEGNVGVQRLQARDLIRMLEFATAHGLACAVHAIGDRANSMVIDAAYKYPATKLRHRIEHVQLIRPEDIEPFARSRWVASVQPSHLVSDRDMLVRYWGKGRSRWAYAFESMRKAGVPLAFGSDVPIEPIDPIFGIYAACSRKHPDDARGPWEAGERMVRYDALFAATVGAAYAAGVESEVGRLLPMQRANFVILDRDILAVPDAELPKAQVVATFVAGRPVYLDPVRAADLSETLAAPAV